jgi:ribosome biogenesis GTPase
MTLSSLGWDPFFESSLTPYAREGCFPARVAIRRKGHYLLYAESGDLRGEIAGSMHFKARGTDDYPSVGDWVAARSTPDQTTALIFGILRRKSAFSRKVTGHKVDTQIIAANIDTALLVHGLDGPLNHRRIERYLVAALESGAQPVVVLNKADLCSDSEESLREVQQIVAGTPAVTTSATVAGGLQSLLPYFHEGKTAVLLGPSGVGKSTIANALLGKEYMATGNVRETDGKGMHATSHRELLPLSFGGLLIDTPGLRELQLFGTDGGVRETFADIEEIATECRFRDCRHDIEPGCAVTRAIDEGRLDPERLENYKKMLRELAHLERKTDLAARLREKQRWKKLTSRHKRHQKGK